MIRSSAIRKEEIFLFQKNITFLLTDRHAVGRQKNREKRGVADWQWHTDNKLHQLYIVIRGRGPGQQHAVPCTPELQHSGATFTRSDMYGTAI